MKFVNAFGAILLEILGDLFSDETIGLLKDILVYTGLFTVVWKGGTWLVKRIKKRKEKISQERTQRRNLELLKDLHPYFDPQTVRRSHELFIETRGQNVPPSRMQEPERKAAFAPSQPLIPLFLNEAFEAEGDGHRFYLVLADSGMGKTTFMINLYLQYLEGMQGKENAYEMKLLYLGYPEVDEEIKEWVKQKKDRRTILLLDAFDEDAQAAKDYKKRMDELVGLTKNFREVVITSRTQFFPNEEEIPGEIRVPRPGTDNPGFHRFRVMYLSPFDRSDIERYLKKKYPGKGAKVKAKREKALQIVERSPRLMVRPMLLAHMDDFLEDNTKAYQYTHEIYEALIEKWIIREGRRKPKAEREGFMKDLRLFSKEFAWFIFKKWKKEKVLVANKKEVEDYGLLFLAYLSEQDIRSRSLLNRDAEGNLKFSHKSILEYFLAKEILSTPALLKEFLSFEGWDMIELFLGEFGLLPEMQRVEGGSFERGSKEESPVHMVYLPSYEIGKFPITQKQWQLVMGNNPSHFNNCQNCPVEQVSWEDCQEFISKLNELTGRKFRLPTEAEWEYAARGGKLSKGYTYAGGNSLKSLGFYKGNSDGKTHPVGQKKANELGLYDMSGNVWEWCEDWYGTYPQGPLDNPTGPESGQFRVLRGGSWDDYASFCRVSNRFGVGPSYRRSYIGFRLARDGS